MTDEVALWKQRILERKANRQTIADWCKKHKVTKGSYVVLCTKSYAAPIH